MTIFTPLLTWYWEYIRWNGVRKCMSSLEIGFYSLYLFLIVKISFSSDDVQKKGSSHKCGRKKKSFCVQYYMEHKCLYESLSLSSVFDTDWWSNFPMKCSHHSKSTNLICGHGRLINNPILLARNGCHVDIDVWIWWTERGLRVTYYLYPT